MDRYSGRYQIPFGITGNIVMHVTLLLLKMSILLTSTVVLYLWSVLIELFFDRAKVC